MMRVLVLLWLLPLVAMERLSEDYEYIEGSGDWEPSVDACEDNGTCQCKISGEWTRYTEYQSLMMMRRRLHDLEARVGELDLGHIHEHMANITQHLGSLEDRIYSQSVDMSVRELMELKKSVEVLHELVKELENNNSTSDDVTDIREELDFLLSHVDELWDRNPYGSNDQLREELKRLRARLEGCKDLFGSLRTSYFTGDTQPITGQPDTAWCQTHDIDSVSDAFTHRFTASSVYTWVKDPRPPSTADRDRVYLRTRESTAGTDFYYFPNYTNFITNTNSELHRYPQRSQGLGTAVYNGSIYWHYSKSMYRHNGTTVTNKATPEGQLSINYLGQTTLTYVDLKTDEYGLWGLWPTVDNYDKLVIHELDPETMEVKEQFYTSKLKSGMCMAFMACGRLYALDICTSRLPPENGDHSVYVYDTVTGEEHHQPLHVTSKYTRIIQLAYNPREKLLLGWDNGHAITYQIRWRNKITGEIEAPPGSTIPEPFGI